MEFHHFVYFVCVYSLSDDYIRQNDFKKPSCKKEKSSWKFDRYDRDMDDDEDDGDDLMDVNSKCILRHHRHFCFHGIDSDRGFFC